MKRILNKILCFMWGHQFEKWFSYVINTRFFGEYRTEERTYYDCKHCGAQSHTMAVKN